MIRPLPVWLLLEITFLYCLSNVFHLFSTCIIVTSYPKFFISSLMLFHISLKFFILLEPTNSFFSLYSDRNSFVFASFHEKISKLRRKTFGCLFSLFETSAIISEGVSIVLGVDVNNIKISSSSTVHLIDGPSRCISDVCILKVSPSTN